MYMNDLVSIILPVYNRQDYLPDCIRSIQAQTHRNYEVILIDDGSTDNTPALCKAYAEEDPRFKLLTGTHSGVSAARNLGLDAASGDFVFFVDSDDAIHPLLLETLVTAMQAHHAAMGGTRVVNITAANWSLVEEYIHKSPTPGQTVYRDAPAALHSIFKGGSPLNMIGGVMMRRDLIGQTRFRTDIFIGEDYYFIYENLLKGADAVFLKQIWYYGRIHGSNSSFVYNFEGFMTRFRRRQLVWQSEEALGRPQHANVEKHSVFMAYLDCVRKNTMPKADRKKMCGVMKQHRKQILPALNFPRKLRFYLTVYFPFTHRLYCALIKK
jgi:glycosyltransferase involved in cell wall biosynthesis